MKQTKAILIALFIGLIVGLALNLYAPSIFTPLNQYIFHPIGQLFIRLIKMLVVPVVFISIALGAAGLGDPKQLGRIGIKSISFFLTTTAIAISLAVTLALFIQPGQGGTFKTEGLSYKGDKAETSIVDTLLNIVPDNPAKAMSDGNMLQIIAFAVLIGLGLAILGKRVQGIHSLLEQGNELMMYLVNLIMKLAPINWNIWIARFFCWTDGAGRRRCNVQVYDCCYASTCHTWHFYIWRVIKNIYKRKYRSLHQTFFTCNGNWI